MCLTILGTMLLLKKLNQPYLIAYIIAGVLLGPYMMGIFKDAGNIEIIGEIGILLFMFFIGMEINVPDSRSLLAKPVIAQIIKIVLSLAFAFITSSLLSLPVQSAIVISILFTFNSTPVVSDFLAANGFLKTSLGLTVLNMLIFQDILLAPVLTMLNIWNGEKADMAKIVTGMTSIVACVSIFLVLKNVRRKRILSAPALFRRIEGDHDMQVFAGLLICLGCGLIAEVSGLSSALGSFMAGVYIGRTNAFKWLEHSLLPFKVFFVALFFVSIGLRLHIPYLLENHVLVLFSTMLVFISNSVLSAIIFKLLKFNWPQSLLAGALLSHTGEFGILVLSVAYKMQLIELSLYKIGMGITGLTLLLSTIWVSLLKNISARFTMPDPNRLID
ncbi:MAG: cation:proton antiporter [Agriterribacter sp.]